MKVSILSDIHCDFYVKRFASKLLVEYAYESYLNPSPKVEVLIVAGDLGHNSYQSLEVLEQLAEIFNYKKVFAVLGNHDMMYSQNATTEERIATYLDYEDPKGIVHILDGQVYTYKGVRFGGAASFYDATYLQTLRSAVSPLGLWRQSMNDSKFIRGIGDFYDIFDKEKDKMLRIHQHCDVMITHINPSIRYDHATPMYADSLVTAFFAFDGDVLRQETTASTWVFGHTHGSSEYTEYGVRCINNGMGYPKEEAKELTIEVKPRKPDNTEASRPEDVA